MEWLRAWYEGSLRQDGWIEVDEAIELRNQDNTKAGDTYCCQCKMTRIGPVAAVSRARHFRRNRKSPDYMENRSSCEGIRKSEQKGETWKHRQIVAEIKYY